MAVTQIPVTVKGAEQLKEELLRLRSVDRPWVIQAIAEARAQGDLSENAEYEAAKERQSFNGKISVSSPISRGLIGKSEGDIAEVMAPGGVKEYEILEVQYI